MIDERPESVIALQKAATEIQRGGIQGMRGAALMLAQSAERALELARDFDDLKGIRDKLRLLESYYKADQTMLHDANIIAKQRLITDRHIGNLLRGVIRARSNGSVPSWDTEKQAISGGDGFYSFLDSHQIAHSTAYRWQHLADIPEPDFRACLEKVFQSGEELTTARILATWTRDNPRPKQNYEPVEGIPHSAPPPPDGDEIDGNYNLANHGEQLHILLLDCAGAFKLIENKVDDDDIQRICRAMRGRIDDLLAEL